MSRGESIPLASIRNVEDRSGGRCEAGLKGCSGAATQFHHKKYRSRGGSNASVNLAHLCFSCHEAVHRARPGTEKFRTHGWQDEGQTEQDWIDEQKADEKWKLLELEAEADEASP